MGQTVAIVDAFDDPNIEADLGAFDSNYGLPACTSANGCFTKVGQTGSTTSLPKADKEGWSVEIALDVETVHSACERCKILLVEANEPTDADLATGVNEAVKLGATEVSNSYGGPEEAGGEEAAYKHPGVVIAASAGDQGYYDWDVVTEGFAAPGFDGPSGVGAPKGLGAFKSNAVTLLTQTSATLNARVNPDGQTVTECEFEYGTSTSYGSKAPCKSLPGSGSSPVAVSASIAAGLTANTEYHFRISATNVAGTAKGEDLTFKTG
jgi:hypothetical protein